MSVTKLTVSCDVKTNQFLDRRRQHWGKTQPVTVIGHSEALGPAKVQVELEAAANLNCKHYGAHVTRRIEVARKPGLPVCSGTSGIEVQSFPPLQNFEAVGKELCKLRFGCWPSCYWLLRFHSALSHSNPIRRNRQPRKSSPRNLLRRLRNLLSQGPPSLRHKRAPPTKIKRRTKKNTTT